MQRTDKQPGGYLPKLCNGEKGQLTRQRWQDIRHPAESFRLWSTRASGYGEPSEVTLDYLREKDPELDSRAVRALLTTGDPRLMRVDGHYIEVHGSYPILMNVDGINIYTKAHLTDASDQVSRIYIGQEELKVR